MYNIFSIELLYKKKDKSRSKLIFVKILLTSGNRYPFYATIILQSYKISAD